MSFSDCLEVLARLSSPLLTIGGLRGPRLIGHFPGILDNKQNIGSADTSTQQADTKGETSRRQTGKMNAIIAYEVKCCQIFVSWTNRGCAGDTSTRSHIYKLRAECYISQLQSDRRSKWGSNIQAEKRASNQHSQTRKQGDVIPAF